MNAEDTNDTQRARWQELVKDAKQDVKCSVPSENSFAIVWMEAERARMQYALCNAAREMDIALTRIKTVEEKLARLTGDGNALKTT